MFISIGKRDKCQLFFHNNLNTLNEYKYFFERHKRTLNRYFFVNNRRLLITLNKINIIIEQGEHRNIFYRKDYYYRDKYTLSINPTFKQDAYYFFPNGKLRDNAYEIINNDLKKLELLINGNQLEFTF